MRVRLRCLRSASSTAHLEAPAGGRSPPAATQRCLPRRRPGGAGRAGRAAAGAAGCGSATSARTLLGTAGAGARAAAQSCAEGCIAVATAAAADGVLTPVSGAGGASPLASRRAEGTGRAGAGTASGSRVPAALQRPAQRRSRHQALPGVCVFAWGGSGEGRMGWPRAGWRRGPARGAACTAAAAGSGAAAPAQAENTSLNATCGCGCGGRGGGGGGSACRAQAAQLQRGKQCGARRGCTPAQTRRAAVHHDGQLVAASAAAAAAGARATLRSLAEAGKQPALPPPAGGT